MRERKKCQKWIKNRKMKICHTSNVKYKEHHFEATEWLVFQTSLLAKNIYSKNSPGL